MDMTGSKLKGLKVRVPSKGDRTGKMITGLHIASSNPTTQDTAKHKKIRKHKM